MFRPRIIPCLLIKGESGLYKTVRFGNANYIGDAMNAVKIFNDFEADELFFLDIDASLEERSVNIDFVKRCSEEAFMPFSVGGGIDNIEKIKKLFNSGAEKVVINSAAISNPDFIREASEIFGSQAIVVSIDVKRGKNKYEIFTKCGTQKTNLDFCKYLKKIELLGAGEILINSIDKDGTMEGYDLQLIKLASETVNLPVIALGGAGNLEDMKKVVDIGMASAASAGSLFVYSGKNKGILINYPEKEDFEEIFK